jgi:hypothetical protein
MTVFYRLLLLVCVIALNACASNTRTENMSYKGQVPTYAAKYRHNLAVISASGGSETSKIYGASKVNDQNFGAALTASLRYAGLQNSVEHSHYLLRAQILNQTQPAFGLDLTSALTIRYVITSQQTQSPFFMTDITSYYTATFRDSPLAIERQRIANEGAAKANIRQFLIKLIP